MRFSAIWTFTFALFFNKATCQRRTDHIQRCRHIHKMKIGETDRNVYTPWNIRIQRRQTQLSMTVREPISKLERIAEVTRIKKNVVPTSILTLIGGAVTEPESWQRWIISPPFLAAFVMIHLLSSTSMIINDLFDIEIDRINNPTRPLVTGAITQPEAIIWINTMISMYCYLGIQYLPPVLDSIWATSLGVIVLYTPILKKICVIKNTSVASTIALTIPFVGWAIINPLDTALPNLEWMWLTMRLVFVSSMYIEILLDISDVHGDTAAGLSTIPVVIGKDKTILVLGGALMATNYFNMVMSHSFSMMLGIMTTYLPMYFHLWKLYTSKYEKKDIQYAIAGTTFSLFAYLLIAICFHH